MQMKKQTSSDERKRPRLDGSSTSFGAPAHSHVTMQGAPIQVPDILREGYHNLLEPSLQDLLNSSEECFPNAKRSQKHCRLKSESEDVSPARLISSSPSISLTTKTRKEQTQDYESSPGLSELEDIPCTNQGQALPPAATLIKLIDLFPDTGKRKRTDSSDEQSRTDDEDEFQPDGLDGQDDQCSTPIVVQSNAHQQHEAASPRPLLDQWCERFQELCEFKEKMGHCSVPHNYEGNPVLARWVKRQRHQYKQLRLGANNVNHLAPTTRERIKALQDLGFVFDCQRTAWDERFAELQEYHKSFLDCNVPSNYPSSPGLAMWVKCQRRQYRLYKGGKKSSMTTQRIAQLESLGFAWDVRKETTKQGRKMG